MSAFAPGPGREKLLIVNADDFGFARGVNDGILEAHTRGILTATTLMANGPAFEHAVDLARRHPALDVGCHLVLVNGRSLLPPHKPYPGSVSELALDLAGRKWDLERELDAQIRRILDAGIRPTHLDTHKHTHLLPAVLRAVARLSRKHNIPWVRRPFDYPLGAAEAPLARRALSRSLNVLRRRFHSVLESHGCRTTDYFAGFGLTGHLRTAELVDLIARLREGSTEFMTHPGYCTTELLASKTRLKETRVRELEALTATRTREALGAAGVRLVCYRDL